MLHYLPILTTLVTFIFASIVFNRYLVGKRAHSLYWAIGLLLYGLGTLSEVLLAFVYNDWVLKLWYLCGAMLTAAWLGQGTVALLVRRKGVEPVLTALLALVSVAAIILVVLAPVTTARAAYDVNVAASIQYQDILVRNGWMTFLTIILNIYGTLWLVGGALYSAYIFWRKRVLANRMYGNILIAAGALMPAMGGTFVKAGLPDWLYASEFLGAILMFAGFMRATARQENEAPALVERPAE